jgi:hypothetical protein
MRLVLVLSFIVLNVIYAECQELVHYDECRDAQCSHIKAYLVATTSVEH